MIVVIDADPIVYRCGFAAEHTSWHLVYETPNCEVEEIEFSGTDEQSAGEQMRAWLALNPHVVVLDKSRVVTPDPVSYALRATNVQIDSIMAECEQRYKEPGRMVMYISGAGGSYRDKIATVRPYKGNRDPSHKPVHYHAIRDHLRTRYNSYITSGIEADDAVSIFAHQLLSTGGESFVVATIDKDLDQIPGNHYNYMTKTFYAITQDEAERWFIYQLLAGDITDNIVGIWKCGEKQATAILGNLRIGERRRDAKAGEGAVSPHWWPAVLAAYRDSQSRPNCPYASRDPEAIAIEMAQLVKLQEYPGQLWHPYGDLVVPGFGEENFDG